MLAFRKVSQHMTLLSISWLLDWLRLASTQFRDIRPKSPTCYGENRPVDFSRGCASRSFDQLEIHRDDREPGEQSLTVGALAEPGT